MKRESYPAFKIAKDFLSKQAYQEWLRLPLLHVTQEEKNVIEENQNYTKDTKLLVEDVMTYWEDFVFLTYNVINDPETNDPGSEDYISFYIARFTLRHAEDGAYIALTVLCNFGLLGELHYKIKVFKEGSEVKVMDCFKNVKSVCDYHSDWEELDFTKNIQSEMSSVTRELAKGFYLDFIYVYNYVYYGDNYFTEQRPLKPKKSKGQAIQHKAAIKRWETTGPSILVLNKLPTEREDDGGEPKHSVRYHQRRGHFKTLRHEKYQHHPKYLIENGIYVKPTWVGELEGEYRGNSYKVLLPPKEF